MGLYAQRICIFLSRDMSRHSDFLKVIQPQKKKVFVSWLFEVMNSNLLLRNLAESSWQTLQQVLKSSMKKDTLFFFIYPCDAEQQQLESWGLAAAVEEHPDNLRL